MILVDTNIISELMRPHPDLRVRAWFAAHATDRLFICVITLGEIAFGLRLLPQGRRRRDLEARFTGFVREAFAGRVLDYTADAAFHFAVLSARRRVAGRPISVSDAQIAGIAQSAGATLATRNTQDFTDCGLALVNPFMAPA